MTGSTRKDPLSPDHNLDRIPAPWHALWNQLCNIAIARNEPRSGEPERKRLLTTGTSWEHTWDVARIVKWRKLAAIVLFAEVFTLAAMFGLPALQSRVYSYPHFPH